MHNNYNALILGLLSIPSITAEASIMHDWECKYRIIDTRTQAVYYADWCDVQSDNSINFIDLMDGKRWLPAGTFKVYTNPNAQ